MPIDEPQEFCNWFNQFKDNTVIQKYLSERNIDRPYQTIAKCIPKEESLSGKEEQQLRTRIFACVDPDEVDYSSVTTQHELQGRTLGISKWATKNNLRSFPSGVTFSDVTGEAEFTNCKEWNYHMPVFSRRITYNQQKTNTIPKLGVTDGRHRAEFAKSKNLCLMAEVTEFLAITQDDLLE